MSDDKRKRKIGYFEVSDALTNNCGGYYTVYPAFQHWAGGDVKGKSRAIVWSAILDMSKYMIEKGRGPSDGSDYFIQFNDHYWTSKLAMNVKTFRESLAWLESIGAITVTMKAATKGFKPSRHVKLSQRFIWDMYERTAEKGKDFSEIKYPSLENTPKKGIREPREPKLERPSLDTKDTDQAWTVQQVSLDSSASKLTDLECPSLPSQTTKLTVSNDQAWTAYELKDIEEQNKEDIKSETTQKPEIAEVALTRPLQAVARATPTREETSFGTEVKQPPYTGNQTTRIPETRSQETHKLPGKEERPPRPTNVEADRPTCADWVSDMEELFTRETPWRSIEQYDKPTVDRACALGWKYAVRVFEFDKISRIRHLPVSSWEVSDSHGKPDPFKVHAAVQASIDCLGVDHWETAEDTDDLRVLPQWSDPDFQECYRACLESIETLTFEEP